MTKQIKKNKISLALCQRCNVGKGIKRRFKPGIQAAHALITYPQQLKFVTPEILADIHDAAFKFGMEDFFDGTRFLDLYLPCPIRIIVSLDQTDPGMAVLKNEEEQEEVEVLEVPFTTNEEKMLHWSVNLQPREVIEGIRLLDKKMERRGYINQKDGSRLFIVNDFHPAQLKIEEVFPNLGDQIYTPETPREIEHMRQQFDFPDQVTVWKDENDDLVFCLKKDVNFLNENREEMRNQIEEPTKF